MTDRYTHEDALFQAIKALLRQHVENNQDHWVDVESFVEVVYRINARELRRTDDFTLSIEVPNALDPDARSVVLRLRRGSTP